MLSINAASAALACSGVPWAGPIGAVRVAVPTGGGAPIVNATRKQAAGAMLSALVVGTDQGILAIEAEVRQPDLRAPSGFEVVPAAHCMLLSPASSSAVYT